MSAHPIAITTLSPEELKGKRVIVRCDFNVQVFEGKILDDLRVRKTLPTIEFLRKAGARVILISHIESKDGTGLRPVCTHMNATYVKQCGVVVFVENFLSDQAKAAVENMNDGDVALFENLRTDEGEKKNDPVFAEALAAYADIYVNDAFSVSHRPHASVLALPALFPGKKYAGVQLMSELEHLQKAFNAPHPFVLILGGAKFETKLPLIQKFDKADHILLGGALLNDILKAKGYNVGKSLVSNTQVDMASIIQNPKLVIPDDVTVEGPSATGTLEVSIKKIDEIGDSDTIVDVGPSMNDKLEALLKDAKFILWNGPMGNYEKGFKQQTVAMAKLVADATRKKIFGLVSADAEAVLGGGDTTAAVAELGMEDGDQDALFVSTGGGAMLEYLLNETLPGVEALV